MSNTKLQTPLEVANMIAQGRVLLLAGHEELLAQLPAGTWIGGTSVNFISDQGGVTDRERILVTDITDQAQSVDIRSYAIGELENIASDYPEHGFTVIILPGLSQIHSTFAKDVQSYDRVFNSPLVGWISGVHLSEIGTKTPKVFAGAAQALDNSASVMHVALPASLVAKLDIINLFAQGEGPTIEFDLDGFACEGTCKINGVAVDFARYMSTNNLDTSLPLVADYNGAMINVSIQSIDVASNKVVFYAPVFKGVKYRFAKPVNDYSAEFDQYVGDSNLGTPVFSCNCILNYAYAKLEGKKTGAFVGPVTFGEIAYVLLNQTLAYVSIDKAA